LPCTIDTYGRWGKLFEEYIQAFCQRAAGNDTKLYNFLITRARNTVSVSLARGVGQLVSVALRKCVNEADECYLADVEKPTRR